MGNTQQELKRCSDVIQWTGLMKMREVKLTDIIWWTAHQWTEITRWTDFIWRLNSNNVVKSRKMNRSNNIMTEHMECVVHWTDTKDAGVLNLSQVIQWNENFADGFWFDSTLYLTHYLIFWLFRWSIWLITWTKWFSFCPFSRWSVILLTFQWRHQTMAVQLHIGRDDDVADITGKLSQLFHRTSRVNVYISEYTVNVHGDWWSGQRNGDWSSDSRQTTQNEG